LFAVFSQKHSRSRNRKWFNFSNVGAKKSSAKILAIDINSEAIELAGINFKNSPFSDRLKIKFQDFKNFESDEKFDLIVCNPPFFEENNSDKDILARQQVELNFENLIEKSSQFLSSDGVFSVIIPSFSADEFVDLAMEYQLNLVRKSIFLALKAESEKKYFRIFSRSKD
jgi:tRNA1Val (adenine37-N6)-methyltransferase